MVFGVIGALTTPSLAASSRGEMEFDVEVGRPGPSPIEAFGSGAPGDQQHDTFTTGTHPNNVPIHRQDNTTGPQNEGMNLPVTEFATLDKTAPGKKPGQLPETKLDSFVRQAGGMAELIYGDEGVFDIPPFFGFDTSHRINTGIHSGNLTTGHPSNLPEAWGYPE